MSTRGHFWIQTIFNKRGERKKSPMISIDDMNYSFLVAPRSNADIPRESVSSDPFRARRRRLSLSGPAVCILTLLACCTRSPELSLSGSRVLQLQSHARRGVGGGARGAGLGRVRCTSRPSVRLSVLPPPSLPRAPPRLPRCPPSSSTLLSSSSSSSTTTSPFQVAASFAHGHTWSCAFA